MRMCLFCTSAIPPAPKDCFENVFEARVHNSGGPGTLIHEPLNTSHKPVFKNNWTKSTAMSKPPVFGAMYAGNFPKKIMMLLFPNGLSIQRVNENHNPPHVHRSSSALILRVKAKIKPSLPSVKAVAFSKNSAIPTKSRT